MEHSTSEDEIVDENCGTIIEEEKIQRRLEDEKLEVSYWD